MMHDSTWNDRAYDVRVSAVIQDEDLELPAIFDCELKVCINCEMTCSLTIYILSM